MFKWLEVSKNRWLLLLALLGVFFAAAWIFFAQIPTEDPPNSALGLTLLFSLKYLVLTKAASMTRVPASIAARVYLSMVLVLVAFDAWLHWAVFTAPPDQGAYGYALYGLGTFLVIPAFIGYFIVCIGLNYLMNRGKR